MKNLLFTILFLITIVNTGCSDSVYDAVSYNGIEGIVTSGEFLIDGYNDSIGIEISDASGELQKISVKDRDGYLIASYMVRDMSLNMIASNKAEVVKKYSSVVLNR